MLNHGFIRFKMLRIQGAEISSADRFRIVLKSLLTVGMLLLAAGAWEEAPRILKVAAALGTLLITVWESHHSRCRMRPRGRARQGALLGTSLAVLFVAMAAAVAAEGEAHGKTGAEILGCLAVAATATAVWSFLRWRRLRAEAEWRLHELHKARRRRALSRQRGF